MRARAMFVAAGIFHPADSGRTEYVLALPVLDLEIADLVMLQRMLARHLERIEAFGEELQVLTELGDVVGADWRHLARARTVLVGNGPQDAAAIRACLVCCRGHDALHNPEGPHRPLRAGLATSTGTSAARGRWSDAPRDSTRLRRPGC